MTSTSAGICPRCGFPLKRKGAGRPPVWCSQRCRRAAYEERRAAATGAVGLEVIDRVEIVDHSLNECVDRVLVSSTACRNVLQALARMVDDGTITPYGRCGGAAGRRMRPKSRSRPQAAWVMSLTTMSGAIESALVKPERDDHGCCDDHDEPVHICDVLGDSTWDRHRGAPLSRWIRNCHIGSSSRWAGWFEAEPIPLDDAFAEWGDSRYLRRISELTRVALRGLAELGDEIERPLRRKELPSQERTASRSTRSDTTLSTRRC